MRGKSKVKGITAHLHIGGGETGSTLGGRKIRHSAPGTERLVIPRKALVVGMGISGRSVCRLLSRRGVQVVATDLRPREAFNGTLDDLEANGCVLRLGGHNPEDFLDADQIIVSPGVPLDLDPLVQARKRNIEIMGELEWAWLQTETPVVAVTGTNGKTTTTALIGQMVKASGKHAFVGGNIGTPLSEWLLQEDEADLLVLEVSSFQLDTASRFNPEVGVLLNVTEDHLDRYSNFAAYANSKFSLFARQQNEHVAILNGDDPLCRERAGFMRGRVLLYSRAEGSVSARMDGRFAEVKIPWLGSFSLDLGSSPLKGAHNEENILAAALASAVVGVSPAAMQGVIDVFQGLPHRVEWVRTWKGIEFFDDSKGTNVGAVVKALENFDRPVLLLMGGRDKEGSYAPLKGISRARTKGIFAFGEAAARLEKELAPVIPTRSFPDLEKAFEAAMDRAQPGEVVLLSPACSSFDQYESYARRGDHFKNLVRALPEP